MALIFCRAVALRMIRNGAAAFALQRLLGHPDLQGMRPRHAQNHTETRTACLRRGLRDNGAQLLCGPAIRRAVILRL